MWRAWRRLAAQGPTPVAMCIVGALREAPYRQSRAIANEGGSRTAPTNQFGLRRRRWSRRPDASGGPSPHRQRKAVTFVAALLGVPRAGQAQPLRLGGLLGAVERVEEAGEGLCVGRGIFPPAKVPDHFAHHIGLAGVLSFVEQVNVNADGEQHIPMFAVFLLQSALDFANDGLTLQRMLGADHHQLVIMPDGGVNLTPRRLTPLGIFVKLPICFGAAVDSDALLF